MKELTPLTEKQRMMLMSIHRHFEEFGWSPTLREIGNYVGIRSTNSVNDTLLRLIAKGYVERRGTAGMSRRIYLTALGEETMSGLRKAFGHDPRPHIVIPPTLCPRCLGVTFAEHPAGFCHAMIARDRAAGFA